jgi:hypothetical protein
MRIWEINERIVTPGPVPPTCEGCGPLPTGTVYSQIVGRWGFFNTCKPCAMALSDVFSGAKPLQATPGRSEPNSEKK